MIRILTENLSNLFEGVYRDIKKDLGWTGSYRGDTTLKNFLCGLLNIPNQNAYIVHHMDGDHQNYDLDNLALINTTILNHSSFHSKVSYYMEKLLSRKDLTPEEQSYANVLKKYNDYRKNNPNSQNPYLKDAEQVFISIIILKLLEEPGGYYIVYDEFRKRGFN